MEGANSVSANLFRKFSLFRSLASLVFFTRRVVFSDWHHEKLANQRTEAGRPTKFTSSPHVHSEFFFVFLPRVQTAHAHEPKFRHYWVFERINSPFWHEEKRATVSAHAQSERVQLAAHAVRPLLVDRSRGATWRTRGESSAAGLRCAPEPLIGARRR